MTKAELLTELTVERFGRSRESERATTAALRRQALREAMKDYRDYRKRPADHPSR